MAKRQATSDLNHENWDQEESDDSEDKGTFSAASKDVLKTRVIKIAKRKTTQSDDSKSVFNQFGGFNKTQKSSFDFLANLAKTSTPLPQTSHALNTATTSSLFTHKPLASSTNHNPTVFSAAGASNFVNFGTSNQPSSSSVFALPKDTATSVNVTVTLPSASHILDNKDTMKTVVTKESNLINVVVSQSPSSLFAVSTSGPSKSIFSSTASGNLFKPQTVQNNIASSEHQINLTNKKPDEAKYEKKVLYYSKLRKLNTSVLEWIKKHVQDTPICILTPIFKDYEKYVNELIDEYENNEEVRLNPDKSSEQSNKVAESSLVSKSNMFGNDKPIIFPSPDAKKTASESLFSNKLKSPPLFSSQINEESLRKDQKDNIFTSVSESSKSLFAQPLQTGFPKPNCNIAPSLDTNPKPFSFSSNVFQNTAKSTSENTINSCIAQTTSITSPSFFSTQNVSSTPFSFSTGTTGQFSFSTSIQKPPDTKKQDEEDDNDDEPPKVEFTPIVEENNVYDKRCKIFFKKDGQYVDNGVCTLYIKKHAENKHQLLVRANTTLGNIMLNLILTSSLPIQKMGKNNVMVVCIPKPEMEPPPIPVLIKVKTSEEADDLLEALNKYKN